MTDKVRRYYRPIGETLGAHPWKPFLRGRSVAHGPFQTQFFTLTKPQFPSLLTQTWAVCYMGRCKHQHTHLVMGELQWHESTRKGNSLILNQGDWILILINHLKSNGESTNIWDERMTEFRWFVLERKLYTLTALLEEHLSRWSPLIGKWHVLKQEG